MAAGGEQRLAIAQLYAEAALALAEERSEAEALRDELDALASVVAGDQDFARFLSSPLADVEERRAVLERIFRGRTSDLLLDLLQVMNRKRRLELVPALVDAYRAALRTARGEIEVRVRTATALSAEYGERLRAAAARYTGKKAWLSTAVDPRLIGGLVVRIGDEKIDNSVRTKLERLEAQLLERASREIISGKAQTAEGMA